ncbi:MAG: spermidine/putrescine ABC transporter substrate-binding protein [Chloroflexi bacterium]|nr:spermidine/putrescine ABC transporter substrate-binding protein [Chloroflexota bacterium]
MNTDNFIMRLKKPFQLTIILWGGMFLTACAGYDNFTFNTPAPLLATTPTPIPQVTSSPRYLGPCGDLAQLAPEIRFLNWGYYIDPEILTQFEQECGVKVHLDIFANNEELIATLEAGHSGYDVVVPTDHAVQTLIQKGLLRELDILNNIPNFANVKPYLLGLYYDPKNKYSVPYQWGVTGIAYNTTQFQTPPTSWSVLLNPAEVCRHNGLASLLDEKREALGAALVYLGYSYNDIDPTHHEEAQSVLAALEDCVGYNALSFLPALVNEEVMVAHAWSGAVAQARNENGNIAFFIPEEGGAVWQDNMVIPIDAPNPYTAEIFINYILDPRIGAKLSRYTLFYTPNEQAELLLGDEYFVTLQQGGMMIDAETYGRLEWVERNEETAIFDKTWSIVRPSEE